MENEIRTRSIRADHESFEKFKVIAEEFPNQAQALSSLISVYEIEKSKAILTDRQTEIESFTSYVQKINEIYNHSLLLNHDAEIRIRAEFEKQLTSKDNTIQDLQERMKTAELSNQAVSSEKNQLYQESGIYKAQTVELEKQIYGMQAEKVKSDSIIKSLTEITTEYKAQAKENEVLKADVSRLEKKIAELAHKNETLTSASNQYLTEIKNLKSVSEKNLIQLHEETKKEIQFLAEKAKLEKGQELLEVEKTYNIKTNQLHEEYQKRIEELLKQMKDPKVNVSKRNTSRKEAVNKSIQENQK